MSLSSLFNKRLSLPIVAAPMFLTSGPGLVIECCKAGIVGTFPALNQRTSEGLDEWLSEIGNALQQYETDTGIKSAPYGVNLIVHKSNPRMQADLDICVKHKVPLIITSLGALNELVERVHSYDGIVFHDVINTRHARKAADAGVDGLIAVCNGAGGHAGTINPFALINEIRQFFNKTILLSGCLSTGQDVATAQMMGADLAYMGTRFISTNEAMVEADYKQKIVESTAADIVYTPVISGVNANFIKQSIENAGIDLSIAEKPDHVDFWAEINDALDTGKSKEAKPWKTIWSAGQGVGSVNDIPNVSDLVLQLKEEYAHAIEKQRMKISLLR